MSVDTWDYTPYLALRFAFWALAWCASLADLIRYKGEKVHGWQLHRCIFGVLCAMVVKEALILAWSIGGLDRSMFYYVLLFFYDLADASFLCLLMVISWGWQITRQTVAEGVVPIITLPTINFLSIVVHDFIFEKEGGHDGACYIQVSHWEANVLLVATLAYLFTIMYMWLWIFQALKVEKARLELQLALGVGKSTPGMEEDSSQTAELPEGASAYMRDPITGGTVPASTINQAVASSVIGGDPDDPEVPVRMTEEGVYDTDDDTTMPMQAKLRLLGRFFEAVSLYFAANFTIIVFNVWTARCNTTESRREVSISRVVLLVVRDLIHFVFLITLIYIFRLRHANPYFILDDYHVDDDEHGQGSHELRATGGQNSSS